MKDYEKQFNTLVEILHYLPSCLMEYSNAIRRAMDSTGLTKRELRAIFNGLQIFDDEIFDKTCKDNNNE